MNDRVCEYDVWFDGRTLLTPLRDSDVVLYDLVNPFIAGADALKDRGRVDCAWEVADF